VYGPKQQCTTLQAFDWFEAIVEIKVSVLFPSSQTFHNLHALMDEIALNIGDLRCAVASK